MDFNQLLARMQELDSPALEGTTEGCGMMPPATTAPSKPEPPEPNMSINVNAQGMNNIESMLALIAKLNNAGKADMPSMAPMSVMSIEPISRDADGDNDFKVGGEMDLPPNHDKDHMVVKTLDKDGDMDHDMDDHKKEASPTGVGVGAAMGAAAGGLGKAVGKAGAMGMKAAVDDEEDEDELGQGMKTDPSKIKPAKTGVGAMEDDFDLASLLRLAGQEEAYANEPDEMNKNADYMNNKLAGGMNRPKDTYPPVADGDNPMQKVGEDDLDEKEELPPGWSRVGKGRLSGPSGSPYNWRDPNMDPDYWDQGHADKYGADNEWDELEKWLSSGSYKSSDWARRQHMLKKYGLDKDITPDNLAAARQKADAIKKAAQDKEDKFHKDKYDAYWRAEDDDTMADFEKWKADQRKAFDDAKAKQDQEFQQFRKNAGLGVGQGWSDQKDIDDLDRVSAKYGTNPASDQTAALAHQEKEFSKDDDSKSSGTKVYKDLAKSAMESSNDLRSQIRAELAAKLEQFMGAK